MPAAPRVSEESRISVPLAQESCLEALLEISRGKPIDDVLLRYAKMPVSVYRAMGADVLPIHAEFEEAFRALGRGERS